MKQAEKEGSKAACDQVSTMHATQERKAAKTSSIPEKLVMAYGENGPALTPESKTVQIRAWPVSIDCDKGTPITPRLLRFLFCEGIDELPHRLISIDPPGTAVQYGMETESIDYWRVTFEFKNFIKGALVANAKRRTVCVFNEADARDPYFAELPVEDRAKILSAVLESKLVQEASSEVIS